MYSQVSKMNAVIGLEDGTIIKGTGFGAEGIVSGELVFTTQSTGYEEALTDPSYKGQILMFTYPLIGNYGVSGNCFESDSVKAEGLIVREACPEPSHHMSKKTINEFMEDEGKPGIAGVDTRMLTIKTREQGAMRAAIINGTDDGEDAVRIARAQKSISDIDLISQVTCPQPFKLESPTRDPNNPVNVLLVDCGRKLSIERSLMARGMDVTVVPGNSSISTIESCDPDLLFFSNGPGNPLQAQDAISAVRHFTGELPIVGICLGHQIISLALGAQTYKMKFGHRGANQPVKDLETGTVHITSQNHGFVVDGDSFEEADVEVTHFNTNDKTVEGIAHKYLDIFSVQYHPDAHPGPMDSEKLFFDKVLKLAGEKK